MLMYYFDADENASFSKHLMYFGMDKTFFHTFTWSILLILLFHSLSVLLFLLFYSLSLCCEIIEELR